MSLSPNSSEELNHEVKIVFTMVGRSKVSVNPPHSESGVQALDSPRSSDLGHPQQQEALSYGIVKQLGSKLAESTAVWNHLPLDQC